MLKMDSLKAELTSKGPLAEELEKILKRFYEKMDKDTMIGFFFQGKNLQNIINQQVKLLSMVMGVGTYLGKPVSQAHLELPPILKGHFHRRLVLLQETLQEFDLSKQSVGEWLNFEKQFERVIVK